MTSALPWTKNGPAAWSPDAVMKATWRALEVQRHLLARGVPAARIGKPTSTATAAVQLRIEIGSS
ncbi:MAG: hypothetical protein MUF16_13390 [Burkholderiaceae bacterium]|nr:hypothetical protein [Burkholderiaceae bacterium]